MRVRALMRSAAENKPVLKTLRFEAETYPDAYAEACDLVPEGWTLVKVEVSDDV